MKFDFLTQDLREVGSGFQTAVADPAWRFGSAGPVGNGGRGRDGLSGRGGGRVATDIVQVSASEQYETMTVDQIAAMNVKDVVADNAHLYLWIPNAFVVDPRAPGPKICQAWGFKPVTLLTWVKHRDGEPGVPSRKSGYYFRGASEQVIFAVRGSLRLQTDRALATWFGTPRRPHSVKPDEFFEMVEEASPSPRLELFGRAERPGWTVLGNEA